MAATVSRKTAPTTVASDKFLLGNDKLATQYGDLYYARLSILRPVCKEAAEARWPKEDVMTKVLDSKQQKCVLIGTLYKEMKLKPCVLDEYTKQFALKGASISASYVSDDDSLVLEDESGRIPLQGESLPTEKLSTGIVVAVLGTEDDKGVFHVEDICYPDLAAQPALAEQEKQTGKLLVVSGLQLGANDGNPLRAQLLIDFVAGQLGAADAASSIVGVVIAGNSVQTGIEQGKKSEVKTSALSATEVSELTAPLRELDVLLTQLSATCPVYLMPGDCDPSGHFMPQQPLHPCLLPSSSTFSTLQLLPNPCKLSVAGMSVLGTSGQNLNDLGKYMTVESSAEMMANTLKWRVLAPTAPDTLGCYPFLSDDPFLVNECPHIYFVGNQPKYETTVVKGSANQSVTCVSVPSFAETGTAVLIDLETGAPETLQFDIEME